MTAPRTRGRVVAGLLAVALVGSATAHAQVDGPTLDDGTWTGTITVAGSFGFDVDQDGATGQMTWSGQGTGPATLVIENGAASGSWSMSGGGTIEGSFGGQGASFAIHGTQDVLEATGSFTGSGGAYRLVGTSSQSVTVTVEVPGVGSKSTTDTSQGTVDAQLRDLLWTCGALVGRWEHEVEQQLEAIGFDEAIEGTLTLVREPQADDTEDALADLSAQLQSALAEINHADEIRRAGAVGQLAGVMRQAAVVAMTLREPSACPASDQHYLDLAADVVRQAVEAMLAAEGTEGIDIPASTLFDAAIAITATGLAGTPEGADLLDATHDLVDVRWTELVTDPNTDLVTPDDRMVEIIVMSSLFFWDLPVGDERISASDLLLTYREG